LGNHIHKKSLGKKLGTSHQEKREELKAVGLVRGKKVGGGGLCFGGGGIF